jgi:hypothetical protein
MKKKLIFLGLFVSILFTSCLSTNSTYGTEKSKNGNLVISYDEFQERTTVNINNPDITNFNGPGLLSFAIYPYFIYDNSNLNCRLTLEIYGTISKFDKIIFITENGKYQLSFSSLNQEYGEKIRNNPYSEYTKGDYRINKEQFLILGEIINSSNLKGAVYTTNNEVLEITEYRNSAKKMYKEFYDYYINNNLSELNDFDSEIVIIKK